MTVNGQASDTPVRDNGAPGDPDLVYLITRIDILNSDGDQWYVQIKQLGVVKFEALVTQQTETFNVLSEAQQFETVELEVRASRNIID